MIRVAIGSCFRKTRKTGIGSGDWVYRSSLEFPFCSISQTDRHGPLAQVSVIRAALFLSLLLWLCSAHWTVAEKCWL